MQCPECGAMMDAHLTVTGWLCPACQRQHVPLPAEAVVDVEPDTEMIARALREARDGNVQSVDEILMELDATPCLADAWAINWLEIK